MSSPFDRPAPPGDQFDTATHVGALLVIDVLEHVPPMVTKASEKPTDAIRANVYVISPQGTVAEEFANTLLFPRIIVSRLRQSVGRKVLGVLTGQPNVKRDGKNVPYDLDDPTPQMEQVAVAAMAAHSAQQMQAAPQQQAWGQQPAQQAPPAQAWGQPPVQQQPGGWQQPPAPQGPPPAYQAAAAGAPPGWGQPPVQQPATAQLPTAPNPWGQQPPVQDPQQQLPAPAEQGPWGAPPADPNLPPWEQPQAQQAAPPWGGQQ